MGLGILAATALMVYEARRRGRMDQELAAVMAGTLLFGAIGAKLATVWRYVAVASDPSLIGALVDGGKSIPGGLAGAYLGALLTKKLVGYRGRTVDTGCLVMTTWASCSLPGRTSRRGT